MYKLISSKIKCNLSPVAVEVSHLDRRPRLESHIQAMVQAGIGCLFPWNSNGHCGSGDVWNAKSTLQVSIWCACGFSAAFGVCNTWADLVSSPQSWKTSNLHPQSSGTLAGSSLSSRARTRGLGGHGSKNWKKKCCFEKNPMPFSHFSSNATVVSFHHQTRHIQVHFEWDDFVRFRELCNINITEARHSMRDASMLTTS